MDLFRLAGANGEGGIISAAVSRVKDLPSWALVVGGAVAVVLLSMVYNLTMRGRFSNLPPGPRNWPVIGAMLEMEPKIHIAFAKLAKRYGPILYFRLGVQPIVVVSSAQIAEELLKHKDGEFADRSAHMTKTAAKYCGFDNCGVLYSKYDSEYVLGRKLVVTEFFTVAKLKTHEELRRQEMIVMVEKVLNAIESTNDSNECPNDHASGESTVVTIGISEMVVSMTLNVIFAIVIGERFDRLSPTNHLREFPEIMAGFSRLVLASNVVDVLPFLTWFDPQGLLKDYKAFGIKHQQFYEKIVRDRKRLRRLERKGETLADSEVTERNFVDVLLQFQEEGAKLSDNYVLGILSGILAGGIHTISTQVEWVMLELARHPKILQTLQAEVDGVFGMDRPVDETDGQLQNMPFLCAVVNEALRLHPIVAITFPHSNKKTTTLAGYTIPANTAVLVDIQSINRDPKVWKDALQFNPDRFMGTEGQKIKANAGANGTNYNLLTFSSGRRGCMGFNLAWVLLLRTTATLVHAFDWSPPPGLSSKDLSSETRGALFLHPIVDLFLTPKPRVPCQVYRSKVAT